MAPFLILAVALTGAFMAGPARARMDNATSVVMLLHLGLGLGLAPLVLVGAIRRLTDLGSWMKAGRGKRSPVPLLAVGYWLLAAALLTGVALIVVAVRGDATSGEALAAHEWTGFLAVALVGASLFNCPRREARIAPHVLVLAALLLVGFLVGSALTTSGEAAVRDYQPDDYFRNLTATNARQARNSHFPAGTTVLIDPGAGMPSSASCGAAGCHPRAYREWLGSPHQRADFDATYRPVAARFEAERGAAARRWCEGCHAPAAPAAEGVNCLACHAMTRVTELSGNGRFEMRVPAEYPFAENPDPRLRWLHAFLLRLRPGPHRRAFRRPELHPQSELCAPCHRTSYNVPQNAYKFLRTEDEYGTWQAGPHSGQSIHGFYPPGPPRRCQDCHATHDGGVRYSVFGIGKGGSEPNTEHRTPNTAAETVDLLALRRPPRLPGAPEELVAPLQPAPLLRRSETVTVEVVVRNRGVGHEFPAGVGNLGETWLDFEVADSAGRLLFRSGGLGPRGALDPGAHTYGLIGLDRAGRRLEHGDLWNMLTPLYHRPILPGQPDTDRRTIQPGESDVVHYRLRVPAEAVGPLTLRARLWSRRLRPSPASTPAASSPAGCSPTLLAADSVTLPVAIAGRKSQRAVLAGSQPGSGSPPSSPPHPVTSSPPHPLPERFYDYGVGLLLQGDLPRARRAMLRVQAWAPGQIDGYLGLGRVYLTEGDLLAARAQFEQAGRVAPNDPRPRAWLGTTDRKMGQYDRALAVLGPLVRAYPRDRLLWFDLGMTYYLTGRYEAGSRAFQAMLGIDPDDLAAHYNLVQCLRRLGRLPEARHEEIIYQSLREDDGARRVSLAYLRSHPLADREARTVHEHPLSAVTSNE